MRGYLVSKELSLTWGLYLSNYNTTGRRIAVEEKEKGDETWNWERLGNVKLGEKEKIEH